MPARREASRPARSTERGALARPRRSRGSGCTEDDETLDTRLSRRVVIIVALVALGSAAWLKERGWLGRATARNVLLITLDTTRADHLGCYGDRDALTPALDGLAARGTVFEQAFTSCPQTLAAHATILTGLQPPEHGLRINGRQRLAAGIPTLAELLAARGYRTAAFVAAFVLNSKFGLDRGFQVYDEDLSSAQPQEVQERLSVYRSGSQVVDAALAWLEKAAGAPGPFFCWVHLYDPHYPHYSHAELAGTPFEGKASYDAEVAFMDRQVARLTAFLEARRLTPRTLVIAVADHGEGLGDHGEMEHGYLLNEEVLRVPLIVTLPGIVRGGARVETMVSLVDLAPTVLDLLGISTQARFPGRSLRPALVGEHLEPLPSYAETQLPYSAYRWAPLTSLTTPHWKYIRTPRPEVYDRTSDRRELYNLESARPERVKELEAELAAVEARMAPQAAPAVALSVEQRRQLESLGYVGGGQSAAAATGALKDIKDMLPVKLLDTQVRRGVSYGTLRQDELVERLRDLVRRSPETPDFQNRLGAALLDADQLEEAGRHLAEAVRLDPELVEAHVNLGRVLARQRKPEEAIPHFTEALRLDPDMPEAHFSMGHALAEQHQLDTALGHYAEAVRLKPDYADAHYEMANVLTQRHKLAAAIEHYTEVLRTRPEFADAHYDLANVLREQGRTPEAIEHYLEAVRLGPRFVDARNNLGLSLAEEGRLAEAEEQLTRGLAVQPDFAPAQLNLGRVLAHEGRAADAAKHFAKAVQLRPNVAEFAAGYAWFLATSPDPRERDGARAVALAEKACKQTAERDAGVLGTLAAAYAEAGRFADAVETGRRAIRVAHASEQEPLIPNLEQRLRLYENGQPFHESAAVDGKPSEPSG